MKTVKNFLIDLGLCLLIALPFHFLCDMVAENCAENSDMVAAKWLIDWLDIQLGLAGVSLLLLIAYMLVGYGNRKSRVAKIVGTMTIVAITATIVYGIFMLLEWWFPDNAESGFTGNWVQWFPVSISIATFLHLQERRRVQSYNNANDLVVAAECRNRAEAEAICAMLEEKGIKATTMENDSPMCMDGAESLPVQVLVMGKELQNAKNIIK